MDDRGLGCDSSWRCYGQCADERYNQALVDECLTSVLRESKSVRVSVSVVGNELRAGGSDKSEFVVAGGIPFFETRRPVSSF